MKKDNTLKMMFGFTLGIRRFFLFSIITSALASLMTFLTPIIMGFTVDSVIGGEAVSMPAPLMRVYAFLSDGGFLGSDLLVCAILVILTAVLAGLFNYQSRVTMAKGAERLINSLRITLFKHTQDLPFEWHTNNLTGDIIQRCTSDVETTRRFVFNQLIEVLRTVIMLGIVLAIMFSLNTIMATVVTVFLPLILFYSAFFFARVANEFRACDEAEGELMVRVQENLTGVRIVRAFGREAHETALFDEKNITYTNKWLALGGTFGAYWSIGDSVTALQLLSVIVAGAFLAADGALTFGELLVFVSYTHLVTWPIRQMGRVLSEMSKTGVALGRIKEILDEPAEVEPTDALTPPMDRDIEFKNVSFSYGESREDKILHCAQDETQESGDGGAPQIVLQNVSFTIKSGSTFGILGATGSGKSTITYLLNRLYDLPENSGAITVGGIDISRISQKHLRRNIGLVLQEPFLFSKTIFENIDIASRGGDLAKVRAAAKTAEVDDNIMSFANGYDTIVGERGVTLSGGQKQRVAIARTLMMDAPIMVFDDSMSSLDIETDAKIREALRAKTGEATIILISHRISTLMLADTIMILEDGKVAEIGSHSELIAKNGIYRRVYDLQSGCSDRD